MAAKHSAKMTSRATPAPPKTRRTTVTLSPQAAEIVDRFMNAARISVSQAVSGLIERTEPEPSRLRNVNGFLVLSDPPRGGEPLVNVTVEDIKRIEEQLDREYVERFARPRGVTRRQRKAHTPQ